MAKIIGVIGSPGSGSTTVAAQLAMQCAAEKETVCLILADPLLPPKSYLLKQPKEESLGSLLAAAELTDKQLLAAMDAVSADVGVIGYCVDDKLTNYPAPTTSSCERLIKKTALCSDTVIVDIGNRLSDRLAIVTIDLCDALILCVDGSAKSAAWKAFLPHYEHCTVVANALLSGRTADADIFLPFSLDLQQQAEQFELFDLYKEKTYRKALQNLYQKTNVKKKTLTLVR